MMKSTGLILAGFLALAAGSADAQVREQKFRLGFQTNLNTVQGQGVQKFADAIAAKSGGKMKMDVFPGGALGGDLQTIAAMRGGTVDASVLATSTLVGLVKEYGLFDLPFLFQNHAEAAAVVDGPFGTRLNGLLAEKGIISFGYWGVGFRNLTNSRRPVAKVEDVKGLKIRVLQNPIYVDLWNALGANAVPMPFPEVYTALEQKAIDGQENPAATIVSNRLYEVQKFYSHTNHIYFVATLIFSKPTWEKLNADERKIVEEAALDIRNNWWRKAVTDEDTELNEQIAKSLQTSKISPAEMDKFRAATKSVVDKHSAAADPAVVKELFDSIAKVRGK